MEWYLVIGIVFCHIKLFFNRGVKEVMRELISVIIAAYNVESWIEKCLSSIVGQTYKDLDIIVVNDGSTDNTLQISEKFAEIDCRVRVITKENGGLSDARNVGIREAKGEIITFVDGDDWLKKYIIEIAVNEMEDADICTFQHMFVDENEKEVANIPRHTGKEIFYNNEAMKVLLTDDLYGGITAWGRLYRKRLFLENNIEFPVGKYHEDCFTTYKLFFHAKKTVFIADKGYMYLQRPQSIVHCNFNVKHLDKLDAADECLKFVQSKREYDYDCAEYAALRWYLQVANRIIRNGRAYKNKLVDIKQKIIKLDYKGNKYLGKKYRMLFQIYVHNLFLYSLILKIFKSKEV